MNNEEYLAQLRVAVLAADDAHRAAGSSPERSAQPPGDSPSAPSHRRLRWLAAAAVVLLVAGAVVALRPTPAAAGLEIIPDADGLTVRLTDLVTRPEEVQRVARGAGLDITVTEEPVGPSKVGKFIGLTSDQMSQIQLVQGDTTDGFTAFRLPLDFDGYIELRMGRAAEEGENWAAQSDATGKGEVLECQDLVGERLDAAYASAVATGVERVRVQLLDEGRWLSSDERRAHAASTVISVSAASPEELQVFVSDEPEKWPTASGADAQGC